MSHFAFPEQVIELFAWLAQNVANLLLQSTALLVVGLFAAWLVRRRGSAVQSVIYRATLVAVLVCPLAAILVAALGFTGWNLKLPETTRVVRVEIEKPGFQSQAAQSHWNGSSPTIAESFSTPPREIVRPPEPAGAHQIASESIDFLSSAVPLEREGGTGTGFAVDVSEPLMVNKSVANRFVILVYFLVGLTWLLGALVLAVRLMMAHRRLAQIRRQSFRVDGQELTICQQLAHEIEVPAPDVRRNSLLSSPCLTGIVLPVILLPTEIKGAIPLEKAFAHELAHLRRHDTLWNLIQRIAVALFFFQPLMWRLAYRLESTAEEVCDDFVVRHCLDRTGYAQQLVELAESNLLAPNMAGLGMFNSRSLLGRRVVRILDTTRQLTTRVSALAVTSIGMLTLFATMLVGLIGNGTNHLPLTNHQADSAAESVKELAAGSDENDLSKGAMVQVSGRVLDHIGKPVSGASIKIMPAVHHHYPEKISGPYATTTSRADGSFEAEVSAADLLVSGHQLTPREKNFTIVATKPGHGMNWLGARDMVLQRPDSEPTVTWEPVDIRLTTDETAIRLTIVDTEGHPIPDAKVKINYIQEMKNHDLAPLIADVNHGETYPGVLNKYLGRSLQLHGLPELQADEKGRLIIPGMGDQRIVVLEINGPTIVSTVHQCMVLDHEPVAAVTAGTFTRKITFEGAATTVTCEPTQPIVGRIVDSKTGQPLAGVRVVSSGFAGARVVGSNRLETFSDRDGRFRLSGMPKGPGNSITAIPSDEQPYFMMRFDVPPMTGLEPAEMTLALEKGIWIRGQALDKRSGEPIIGARLYYLPFISNELASQSPVYGPGQHMEVQTRYLTQEDGSFQLVGMPGRGVVGILDIQGMYPSGMGWDEIDENEKTDDETGMVRTHHRPITPFRKWPTAMKQVDIEGAAKEHRVNFNLDSGLSFPLKVVAPTGDSITGVEISRLRSQGDYSFTSTESIVYAGGFAAGETRLVHFEHKPRKLSRVIELNADELGQSKDSRPKLIELLPNSIVSGRLVDQNGEPVVGAEIRFDIGGSQAFGMELPIVSTNNEGQFRHEAVSPGTIYDIAYQIPGGRGAACRRLEVPVGEQIDLGTINISNEIRPEPKRTPLPNDASGSQGESGNRVATENRTNARRDSGTDKHPIIGKLIDTEGNPVSGATIKVERVIEYRDYTVEELASQANASTTRIGLPGGGRISTPRIPPVISNELGEFKVLGIGDNRIAQLTIVGENVAIQKAVVATIQAKHIENLDAYWGSLDGNATPVRGCQPTFVCEPSQPIDGVVIDRATKSPLANVVVTSYCFAGPDPSSRLVGVTDLKTMTDQDGRFRLVGMPRHPGNQILAFPNLDAPDAQPYIAEVFDVAEANGVDPVPMKLDLERGIWVRGRVIDQDTGQPLEQVRVSYQAAYDNEQANQNDAQQGIAPSGIGPQTDQQGEFKLVGVPGVGYVSAIVHLNQDYPLGQGWRDIDSVRKSKIRYPMNPRQSTGIKEVNLTNDSDAVFTMGLSKGKSVRVKTVAEDGTPVAGVTVRYLPDYVAKQFTSDRDEFDVSGILPGATRTLVMQSIDKKRGTVVRLGLGEPEPVIVKLENVAQFKASLVGGDGKPAAGKTLEFGRLNKNDQIVWRVRPIPPSDQNGRVDQALIPGTYVVSISTPGGFSGYKKFKLEPGDEFDLGIVDLSKKFSTPVVANPMSNPIELLPTLRAKTPRPSLQPRSNLQPKTGQDAGQDTDSVQVRGAVFEENSNLTTQISGRVESHNGQSIAQARIQFNIWKRAPRRDLETVVETFSNSQGEFDLTIDQTMFDALNDPVKRTAAAVVVHAENFGRGELLWNEIEPNRPIVFRLETENVVHGRVIDLEGHPVVDAEVEVFSTRALGKELSDRWLETLNRTKDYGKTTDMIWQPGIPRLTATSGAIGHVLRTNQHGEFTTKGLPRHAIVNFQVKHPAVTTRLFQVLNRPMASVHADPDYVVYGDNPLIITQPGRPIVGTVVDSETGAPVVGARVRSQVMGVKRHVFGSGAAPSTFTDQSGAFELLGMPKSSKTELMVYPPIDQPYLIKEIMQVPETVGLQPAKLEIKLDRGVWISGQVIDQQTGKGVPSVLRYFPLLDNPYFQNSNGFQTSGRDDGYTFFKNYQTEADGKFRVVGLPGKAVFGAQVSTQEYRSGVGIEKVFDELATPYSAERIKIAREAGIDLGEKRYLNIGTRYAFKNVHGSSFIAIDVPIAGLELENAIELDPGHDVSIDVVAENGEPIEKFLISRYNGFLDQKEFSAGRAVLPRMGDDELRTIWVESSDGTLGAIAKISGNDAPPEERTVVCLPKGQIRGRLTDPAGRPLIGYTVNSASSDAVSNQDGVFLIKGLIASDSPISLTIQRPKSASEGNRRSELGEYTYFNVGQKLVPGETVDIGQVNVDPTEVWLIRG